MSSLYWGQRACPHCGKDIQPQFAELDQLAALFDEASRERPNRVPVAICCPHCYGMIKAVLEPTVTIIALDRLAMAPIRLASDDRPAAPKRTIQRRAKSAA